MIHTFSFISKQYISCFKHDETVTVRSKVTSPDQTESGLLEFQNNSKHFILSLHYRVPENQWINVVLLLKRILRFCLL